MEAKGRKTYSVKFVFNQENLGLAHVEKPVQRFLGHVETALGNYGKSWSGRNMAESCS